MKKENIEKAYQIAKETYAEFGVDVDKAINALDSIPISLHCWQGDDVGGFEKPDSSLSGGGIMATGNYPGKARSVNELRADLENVFSLIPGPVRLNLHAIYGEFGGKDIERSEISPEHFTGWVDWAKSTGVKLDFNATLFSHPMADSGFTLSDRDPNVRAYWIQHVKRCREISAYMGRELGSPCIHNLWIADGSKDIPYDRWAPRRFLKESLDEVYRKELPANEMKDAVECKLFGIGSESYVVGSHEFYMGYAISRDLMICLDMGHFHPTESIADKISAVMQFSDELLLHVSRGVRWDSDHVVIVNDDVKALANELVAGGDLSKYHIGLDFFDASINRIAAWAIGTRAIKKALLIALLRPNARLEKLESAGDYAGRLALIDENTMLPYGAIWNYYCQKNDVPAGFDWMTDVYKYEKDVLNKR